MKVKIAVVILVLVLLLAGCAQTTSVQTTDPTTDVAENTTTTPTTDTTTDVTEETATVATTAPAAVTTPQATEPTQPIRPDAYPAGTYEVGSKVPAGEYVFIPYDPDQEATVQVQSGTTTVVMERFLGQFFWQPKEGEVLTATDCYFFPSEGYVVGANPDGSYGPGMYRIGIDIPEGEYQIFHNSSEGFGRWLIFYTLSDIKYPGYDAVKAPIIVDVSGWKVLILCADTYACEAPEPEDPTFIFPDAPETVNVEKLPADYNEDMLVQPYWEQGIRFGEASTFYISIPYIYPFSEEAIACQTEIYDLFSDELKHLERYSEQFVGKTTVLDMTDITITDDRGSYFGYSAGYRNGILSILIRMDQVETGRSSYHVYNFEVLTGERLDEETARAKLGFEQSAAIEALTDCFEEVYDHIPDKTVDFYHENLEKTISSENVDAARIYVAENNEPMMVANIYTIGSVESIQKLVALSP